MKSLFSPFGELSGRAYWREAVKVVGLFIALATIACFVVGFVPGFGSVFTATAFILVAGFIFAVTCLIAKRLRQLKLSPWFALIITALIFMAHRASLLPFNGVPESVQYAYLSHLPESEVLMVPFMAPYVVLQLMSGYWLEILVLVGLGLVKRPEPKTPLTA